MWTLVRKLYLQWDGHAKSQKSQNCQEPMDLLHRHNLVDIQQKPALYLKDFCALGVPNCKNGGRDICGAGSAQKADLCPMQFPQIWQQVPTSFFHHKCAA